jgi:hypothetical protein
MTYIIDPSVFYWINVLGMLQTVLAILGSFGLVGGIIAQIYGWRGKSDAYDTEYDSTLRKHIDVIDDREMQEALKWIKRGRILSVVSVIFIIAAIFVPGKATSIEMLIAKTATFENVNMSVESIKELIDYIVTAIKSCV